MAEDSSEAQIRAIIAARAKAVHAGDVDAMMADVAPDVTMFDVVDPLRHKGAEALRQRAAAWVAAYDGAITWEDRDVSVTAADDVGFSHCLCRVTGRLKSGGDVDMWFRKTLGFRRIGGYWLIVHDHGSVPFDPASGKASLGLEP